VEDLQCEIRAVKVLEMGDEQMRIRAQWITERMEVRLLRYWRQRMYTAGYGQIGVVEDGRCRVRLWPYAQPCLS
jgi:hypothetical protein